jgi:NADPH:quinone reductase-like Zn-dependent oxidoreductase
MLENAAHQTPRNEAQTGEKMMKAMVYHEYGLQEVLQMQEIETPTVGEDEVLVKVYSASVNWLDWHFLTGTPFLARVMGGLLKPKNNVLGIDLAGKVEIVGASVKQFRPGDEVFGSTSDGCFAEYVCVHEDEILPKPTNITFEEAAAAGAAAFVALQGLCDAGGIETGNKVLIIGASGGVGSFAIQIAKSFGADVTGVCSTGNKDMVLSMGADHVIDYTQDDFTQNGGLYDLIFDTVAKHTFSDCKHVLCVDGIYVTTEFTPGLAIRGMWNSKTSSKKMIPLSPKKPDKNDQVFIRKLLEDGNVNPVIDCCFTLSELPEALRHLEKGHARGKVIIKV